ncbi:MAG TPA: glycosyltransferase family A protein [Gammaproteobacteria bacterium]|nr:glycosyltransferase family A protein [Gammaproteobacteria bacterium]
MTRPLFSIFIPTYNRIDTLPRALESVACQHFRDFELIIVDDGSEDGTGELVNRWKQHFNGRLRYFWQENQGKHVAYNLAAREAEGELLVLLDSDDVMLHTRSLRWNNAGTRFP